MAEQLSVKIRGLSEIADDYDAILCDVWGVLHNGVAAYDGAIEALSKFKARHGPVVLLTNAPRPNPMVLKQLDGLSVPLETTFDTVVTSGDVTRGYVTKLNGPIFHIGTDADKSIYQGLDITLSDWDKAGFVVCTGLYDDFNETPEDYTKLLGDLKSRDLTFVCANPDLIVEHGIIMRWCAGALAKEYEKIGGKTVIVGKPHKPVYEHALESITKLLGEFEKPPKILAIGDAIATDVQGAIDFGLDVVFISAGIHSSEYGDVDNPDPDRVHAFLANRTVNPIAWMPRLKW